MKQFWVIMTINIQINKAGQVLNIIGGSLLNETSIGWERGHFGFDLLKYFVSFSIGSGFNYLIFIKARFDLVENRWDIGYGLDIGRFNVSKNVGKQVSVDSFLKEKGVNTDTLTDPTSLNQPHFSFSCLSLYIIISWSCFEIFWEKWNMEQFQMSSTGV